MKSKTFLLLNEILFIENIFNLDEDYSIPPPLLNYMIRLLVITIFS